MITARPARSGSDICHVLARRWPLVRVVLVAAKVQGDDAPASLVAALRRVERYVEALPRRGRKRRR